MARDLSLRIVLNAQDNTGAAFGRTQQGLAAITQQVEGIKARLTGLLGLSVADILFGKVGELIKTADAYKTMEARLKLVSDNTKEFATAQTALFDIAQRSRGGLESTYNLYGKVETAIKSMGGTQQQALKITETLNQAIALTSQGMQQDAAAVMQFNQALGSGVLRGDEFNSVMENSPGLAQALADGLGVAIGQLRGMAEAGQLTSDKIIDALGKVAPSVAEKFNQLPMTVGQAMTQLSNVFVTYVGGADKASGASAKLASVISGAADNFTTIAEAALGLAEIYGTKLAIGLAASAAGYITQFRVQTSARTSAIALAEANVALAAGNTELAQSNLARVQSDLRTEAATLAAANASRVRARAEIVALRSTTQSIGATEALRNATIQLAQAETARSASLAHITTLGSRQAAISGQVTAAQAVQTESTLALGAATNATSVAMGRAAVAGKAAFAFIGGPIGLAAIALYALYTALEKVTGSEEKAATKAKALADSLALSNAEVKKLSEAEVDIDFAKTNEHINEVQEKIKALESFNFGKLFNLSGLAAQRDNLLQMLDALKQRKDALVAQKTDTIINFDASALSAEQLSAALEQTKTKITEISNRIEPLQQQVADGFIGSEAVNADLALLAAYKAKLADLQAVTGEGVKANTQMQASLKATEAAYKEFFTTVDALYQQELERVNQREQQQTLDLEKSVTDEQERSRKLTDIILQANTERISLATNYAAEQTRITEAMYNKEIEKARSSGLSVAGIEQALFAKRIEILKALEIATKSAIDKMIADEQRHLQAARAAAEARKNLAISTEEAILAFLRESMDEQQKTRSIINEQDDLQSKLRKAQAGSDFEEQQRISKRLMELAFERGHTERKIAEENGDSVTGANNRAVESYRAAAQAGQDALRGMQTAEEAAAGKAHAAAEAAKESLRDVQGRIGELQRKLSENTASKHIVVDNVDEVLAKIKSLNNQNTSSTHTVKQETTQARQNGGPILRLNSGGKLSGYGGGDTVPAMLEPGEFVVRKEAVDKYGSGLFAKLNAMNVNVGDVVKRRFGGIIPGFAVGGSVADDSIDKEKERRKLHLVASQAGIVKQKAEKEQLKAEVDAIKKKIGDMALQSVKQGTPYGMDLIHPISSDPTLNMLLSGASVAAFSKGGVGKYLDSATNVIQLLIRKLQRAKKSFDDLPTSWNGPKLTYNLATGGSVPGSGNTDTVPAMLTPGEWVIKKAAVAKYGNAFMDSVNRGVLPKNFNVGGPVGAAAVGGNVVVQFKAPGGQTAQAAFGSQSDVNQFLEVIKLSGGVTA